MAFHTIVAPIAAVFVADILPSISFAIACPLRTIRRHRLAQAQGNRNYRQDSRTRQSSVPLVGGHEKKEKKKRKRKRKKRGLADCLRKAFRPIYLPECLNTAPMDALRMVPFRSCTHPLSIWMSSMAPAKMLCLFNAYTAIASRRPLSTYRNLLTTTSILANDSSPLFRSTPSIASLALRSTGSNAVSHGQRRSFSSSPNLSNPNVLALAERTANNNPASASAQNAFYSALLRANLPKLVIERYETGRYDGNAASDSSYLKALQMTGTAPSQGTSALQAGAGLTPDKLQAVGQAIAGQVQGGQVVRPGTTAGTGAKESPLYVVVEESWGSTVLKWVKTFLWVGLAGYFLLVVLTMIVEMTGNFRPRGGQNNEVRPQNQTVRFTDVHGCDEAKEELQELVEFLLNPTRFNQLGGKLPKGVLLVGPPGTGKTMLARAVAGEAGCPVFYMSGSEFDELYVGVGAKRVRDLFAQARNKAPSIIFIDELDAVGGKRNARDPAYAKQTLNQLLTELDGFSPSTGVILIAATNYPESLDKALTRPGRFDRHVTVPLPDVRGRIEILKHHIRNVPVTADVDVASLARATSGFSGADLENMVNQAAIHASRLKYKKVNAQNFEWAKDKIMMGAESKSRMIRESDKVMTAYHEAGHCLVNLFTPASDQLYKMTIIPRGQALGVTHMLPEMDAVSRSYDQYIAQIDVSMGGRAAEELIYGPTKVSSGISSDVSTATNIARHLVMRFGFSAKLGNVDYASDYDRLSSETKQLIESEVREIVEGGRKRADAIMKEKRKELEALKDALLEFETLDRAEIEKILRGEKLQRLQVELRDDGNDKRDNSGPRGSNPQDKISKETSTKGGVGIKIPEVLLPPGAGTRNGDKEGAQRSER